MVARFNFKCDSCGSARFTATGFANDEPDGDSQDEWKFRLIFSCENCSQTVTEVVKTMNGNTRLEMKFAR